MPRREALIVETRGERFRFYYDQDVPEVLHIMLRQGTTPVDAVRTFFEGETHAWNDQHARFETSTETHQLYWTRHAYDDSVIVISCFVRGDE